MSQHLLTTTSVSSKNSEVEDEIARNQTLVQMSNSESTPFLMHIVLEVWQSDFNRYVKLDASVIQC